MKNLTGVWIETNPMQGQYDIEFDVTKAQLLNLWTGAILRSYSDPNNYVKNSENITVLEIVGNDREIFINKPYSELRESLRRSGQVLDL